MNEQPNQSEFSETACPIGPIGEFEKDSRSFYFARLFHRPYQGRFDPLGGRRTWAAGTLKKLSESAVEEFLVFADSHFIARGGHCGMPPAGGCYNWPLAAPLGKWLITIESPLEVAAMELVGPQVRFWSL